MSQPAPSHPSFSRAHRWLMWLNTFLAILAFLALLAMVNYLAGGYFKRFDLDSQFHLRLSPQTLRVLDRSRMTNEVAVTIFFNPRDEEGYEKELYSLTAGLLEEYRNANPKRITVRTLNYESYPDEAKALLARIHLANVKEKDFILFESNGHSKIVYANTLSDYDLSRVMAGEKMIRRKEFRGEMLFTSAIFAVTHPLPLKAYFLQGHGEADPESKYSVFATTLKEELDAEWQTLSLQGTNPVPSDCKLLIIAGARLVNFSQEESAKIDDYLKKGNRMLLLLDNSANAVTGIESLLEQYGVSVSKGSVFERNPKFMMSDNGSHFMAAQMERHPTVDPIINGNLPNLHFVAPRYFEIKGSSQTPGAAKITRLAATSEKATNGREEQSFPIMLAIEKGVIKGVNAGTRIIVAGDASLFSDERIDDGSANHVFANLALNWLLNRPDILLSGLTPRPIKDYKLVITSSQTRTVQMLFLAGLPGSIIFLGWLVWLRRRR